MYLHIVGRRARWNFECAAGLLSLLSRRLHQHTFNQYLNTVQSLILLLGFGLLKSLSATNLNASPSLLNYMYAACFAIA